MLRLLTLLIFLLPFLCLGQKEIYPLPNSPEIVWEKCIALYKSGKLDSVQSPVKYFKNHFSMIDSVKQFYIHVDTIKYTNDFFAVGKIILDPFMEFERKKYGEWAFYYPSGKIYGKGQYSIGAITDCQYAGPSVMGYSFKTGEWKYWYENGSIMAKGVYVKTIDTIRTSCGIDSLYESNVTAKWKLFDSSGKRLKDPTAIIAKINDGVR